MTKISIKTSKELNEKVNNDYYRLKYHLMPSVGFLNDPNGFIQFNGEYHLFYQFNPLYPKDKIVYWAHVKSSDLIHWSILSPALCPSEWYETHGCYSGSAVNNNGKLTLIYTGNVKNKLGKRETYQCIAQSIDCEHFVKYKNNPVISNVPTGYTTHFRDPKVWKYDGLWYMAIGAQTEKEEGVVLLYSSQDLLAWNKIGEVAGANINGLNYLGYMWECPNLFNLDGKDILLFCPQGVEPKGDLYNNRYQCGYLLGKLDYKTAKLAYGDFIELDRGFEFYAPQVSRDEKGRLLLVGWMGIPEEEDSPTVKNNWLHCLTIVRELHLENNKIYQNPVEEIKLLRTNETRYDNVLINNEQIKLDNIYGDCFELICDFSWENVLEFGIKLRCDDKENEKTLLYYNTEEEKIILDRCKSGLSKTGVRKCKIEKCKKLSIRLFMDKSSVEIFVNKGEETFSSRIYPKEESKNIFFYAEGGIVNVNIKHWNI
ncbi:glycoside hydrolase family 32 protein [Clostridium estertheticum]|uniref:glycoside hydrolase family 32 protein n=1 Tax=Clostridium estertheticum TaxID=238834 RepID=UPI00217CE388|nr:sucrose-6-phosphate hydrolase [Clostridium estertheticum]